MLTFSGTSKGLRHVGRRAVCKFVASRRAVLYMDIWPRTS